MWGGKGEWMRGEGQGLLQNCIIYIYKDFSNNLFNKLFSIKILSRKSYFQKLRIEELFPTTLNLKSNEETEAVNLAFQQTGETVPQFQLINPN